MTQHDWWQDVYEGHVVPVESHPDGLIKGLAVRAWYADGERAVRIVPANGEDEIIGIAGMWRQDPEGADEPSPGDVAADQIEAELPGAQVGSPTVTALANQTVRAWATVDTATGLVVGLHEGAATARAAARRAVANGGLVRAEHLTLIVVRS